jgi:hypothetical protein
LLGRARTRDTLQLCRSEILFKRFVRRSEILLACLALTANQLNSLLGRTLTRDALQLCRSEILLTRFVRRSEILLACLALTANRLNSLLDSARTRDALQLCRSENLFKSFVRCSEILLACLALTANRLNALLGRALTRDDLQLRRGNIFLECLLLCPFAHGIDILSGRTFSSKTLNFGGRKILLIGQLFSELARFAFGFIFISFSCFLDFLLFFRCGDCISSFSLFMLLRVSKAQCFYGYLCNIIDLPSMVLDRPPRRERRFGASRGQQFGHARKAPPEEAPPAQKKT